MMPTTRTLDVYLADKVTVAVDIVLLSLRRRTGAPLPDWEPGAHIDLLLENRMVRQYSLCGDPADPSSYQIAVLREDCGRGGSRFIHDVLTVGTRLAIRGPRNHFPLVDADRYLFIAGGIGITPIIPMIAAVAGRGATWRLVYEGRTLASMAFHEVLASTHPARTLICPRDENPLLDPAAILGRISRPTTVYCCGSERLLRVLDDMCADNPLLDLHLERFDPKAIEATDTEKAFEVELARSGRRLTVGPDDKLIDVLIDAGIPVGASCLEGMCGSCETAVLDGEPEHRDSVLTSEQKDTGNSMMVCVSRGRTRLVLDL